MKINANSPDTVLAAWTELNTDPKRSPVDRLKHAPSTTNKSKRGIDPVKLVRIARIVQVMTS